MIPFSMGMEYLASLSEIDTVENALGTVCARWLFVMKKLPLRGHVVVKNICA